MNDLPANGRDADRRKRKVETPEQHDDRLKGVEKQISDEERWKHPRNIVLG